MDDNNRADDEFAEDEFGEDEFGGFVVADTNTSVGVHNLVLLQEGENELSSTSTVNSFSEDILIVDTVPIHSLPGQPATEASNSGKEEVFSHSLAFPSLMTPPAAAVKDMVVGYNTDSGTDKSNVSGVKESGKETCKSNEKVSYNFVRPIASEGMINLSVWKELYECSKIMEPASVSFPLAYGALTSSLFMDTSDPHQDTGTTRMINDLMKLELLEPSMGVESYSNGSEVISTVLELLQFNVDDSCLT